LKPTLKHIRPKITVEKGRRTIEKLQGAARGKPRTDRASMGEANPERHRGSQGVANPERLRANQKAWETKRVVCEHCHKEVAQSGFKAHQRTKKCLAVQDADL
jgi:hypothetical protein